MRRLRVLLLAGTAEAVAVATRLGGDDRVEAVASLAGRTHRPAPLPCPVRTGGFGGVEGLRSWLRDHGTDAVLDATHPFAALMPHHAARAAADVGVARLRLLRPPWSPVDGDRWIEVDTLAGAATALATLAPRRVLLTTGRLDLASFAPVRDVDFVVRAIEPPGDLPWPGAVVLRDRGPYTVEGEAELLRSHGIEVLVTKNSGGQATAAKLAAARSLGVPVVMVRRPPPPPGPVACSPADAVAWLGSLASAASRGRGVAEDG
ncbi:MAG TPA: cobalt-precorrin-6A reductase [Acidimicrobiales bacterium]|nr:cobalt-precorrin-6A reductase [Acidimicrobiales bacterium]